MNIKLGALARGLATYVPGMPILHRHVTRTGGTDSARYCYSVWLRHLIKSYENGRCTRPPIEGCRTWARRFNRNRSGGTTVRGGPLLRARCASTRQSSP